MEVEVEAYHRDYKNKILSLLSLSGFWLEDSRNSKGIHVILLGSTIVIEVTFLCFICNFGLIDSNKINFAVRIISSLNGFTFFITKTHFATMDDLVKTYYHDYKSIIISFLLLSGLWPDDSKQSKLIRKILAIFSFSVFTILILGIINFTIYNSHNIMAVVGGCGSIISFSTACVKVVTMMLLWRDVKSLNGGLSALFESDLKVPEYREHLLVYYRPFYLFFKADTFYCLGVVVLTISIPIISAFHGRYVRASAFRVPFNYTPGGPLHWTIFAFEVGSIAYMAVVSVGVDTIFGLFSLHMVGELRLLSYRFRCLKPGENYRQDLKDCIDRHCLLIDYKYMIEKVFGLISAWLALSCAIVICALIFQVTQSKNVSIVQIFFVVDYIMAKLLQAYTFAWFGNTITVESEKCVESIYHCGWAESCDLRIMKDILIIQLQSPLYINAMGIMVIRLDMFVKIVHASISYFFLLKTIQENLA